MTTFPHVYTTNAQATNEIILKLSAEKLPPLEVSPSVEVDGPEGYWSPEAFFSASVSTCFILNFKAGQTCLLRTLIVLRLSSIRKLKPKPFSFSLTSKV